MKQSRHRLIALGIAGVAALSSSSLTSCRSTTEIEYDTIVVHDTITIDTCHTPATGDLLRNGGFAIGGNATHDLSYNEMDGWDPYKGSPQTVPQVEGKSGVIQMWGNGDPTIGEGIAQRLGAPLMSGMQYKLQVTWKFYHDNPENYTDYVRLRIVAYDDFGNIETIGTLETSDQNWSTMTIPTWIAQNAYTHIGITVENDNVGMNSASWARLDEVKLSAL